MTSRRQFIQQAGAITLGSALFSQFAFGEDLLVSRPIGIQLFTLFGSMNEDPKGTLEKVAAVGYNEVESAFSLQGKYYGYTAKEFRALVSGMGMTWRAHHASGAPFRPRPTPPASTTAATGAGGTPPANRPPGGGPRMDFSKMPPMLNLRDNYQQLVDEAAEGGLSYLVCSSTPVSTLDEIQKSIEVFQKTGEAAKKAGIGFAYHNHATEFDAVEGAGGASAKTPYELILSQTDKELVKMELDLAWAVKAGKDPVALFNEHPGRFPLWHVKDIMADRKTITEVGNGVVDFKRAFAAAKTAGLKYFFVEQDMAPDPVNNITTSITNLKKIVA